MTLTCGVFTVHSILQILVPQPWQLIADQHHMHIYKQHTNIYKLAEKVLKALFRVVLSTTNQKFKIY